MADDSQPQSTGGCLLQLFWTLVGPGLVLAMGALLVVNHPPLGAWPDFAFLGLVVMVGLARLLDRTPPTPSSGGGADGVATSRWKYVALLAGIAVLILVIAHVVAPRMA